MRSTIVTFVLTAAVWMLIPWAMRLRRARMSAAPSLREVRGYHLHNIAVTSVVVGVTWFSAWLMTDAGPQWLHALAAPAALIFIAVGALLAGYAGWLGGP